MMPFQVMRLRAVSGAVSTLTGSLIGSAYAVDQSSATATLSVPAGTTTAHRLIAVLRCRGDRSFTIPGGWTVHQNLVLPLGAAADSSATRVYIVSKAYASESTVSFTQSVAAAYGFALFSVKGNVVAQTYDATGVATITKSSSGSLLLAVRISNGTSTMSTTMTTDGASDPYTRDGQTSVLSGGSYFYAAEAFKKDGRAAGTVAAYSGSGAGLGIWLVEIGS